MTDHNSMKVDEYAQRLGTQEERDAEPQRFAESYSQELSSEGCLHFITRTKALAGLLLSVPRRHE